MYPARDLRQLAYRKDNIRLKISLHRTQCADSIRELARPLEPIDRLYMGWRRIGPMTKLAAIPFGFFIKRLIFKKKGRGLIGSLVRAAPLAWNLFRGFSGARRA